MGTFVERLLYIIDSDASGANREMEGFASTAEKSADRAMLARARVADLERSLARRPASATTAAKLEIARREAERAEAATASLTRAAGGSSQAVGSMLTSVGTRAGVSARAVEALGRAGLTSGQAIAAGSAVAAAGVGVLAVKVTNAWSSYATSVREFQRASGASAEDASRFVAVLDDLEIDASAAATAVFRLGRVDAGNLRAVGVEIAHTSDGTTDLTATLLNVADAYNATLDPARRSEIAFAAFGRQGRDLVPLLEQGREGLARFFAGAEGHHQVLSQEELNRAREYDLAIDELSDTWSGLGREIAALAAGPLTFFIDRLSDVVGLARWARDLFPDFGGSDLPATLGESEAALDSWRQAYERLVAAGEQDSFVARHLADAIEELEQHVAGSFATDRAAASRRAADAYRYEQEQLEELAQAQLAAANATLTNDRASLGLQRAVLSVAEAERALREVQEQAVQRQRALRDAEERLADARRGLSDATATVAERQREYDRIVHGYGATSREAAAAQRELSDAMNAHVGAGLDVADAYDRLADAQAAYTEAVAQYGAQSEEADDARRALSRAQYDASNAAQAERDANEAQADAQKNLNETINGTGPASEAAQAAHDALRAAQEQQRQAAIALRNAEEAHSDALRAGANASLDRRNAELALQEALLSQRETYVNYARSVADAAKAQAESNGAVLTAQEYNALLVETLADVTKTAPDAARALAEYFAVLDRVATPAYQAEANKAYGQHQRDRMADMGYSTTTIRVPVVIEGRTVAEVVAPHLPAALARAAGRGAATS